MKCAIDGTNWDKDEMVLLHLRTRLDYQTLVWDYICPECASFISRIASEVAI